MGKLTGKKLLLLGERDGIPGPAMAEVFANSAPVSKFLMVRHGMKIA